MKWNALIALCVLAASATNAFGLIDPNFTPVDMVQQADLVLHLEFQKVDDKGEAVANVVKVLKGTFEKKTLTVSLLGGAFESHGQEVMGLIRDGQKEAVFFSGMFERGGGGGGGGGPEEGQAFLHMAGPWNRQNQWWTLSRFEDDVWDMNKQDGTLLGTWNGSSDKLLLAVKYVLADPAPVLRVDCGVEWAKELQFGKFDGQFSFAHPVDVTGAGKADLFIAGQAGDHVFRWNGKTLEDVTAKHGLKTASLAAAWGDFNGDGKLDLASWNGKQLSLQYQKADGTFDAKTCDALKDGCLTLTTIDSGNKGRAALLAGTAASPVLLTAQDDGGMKAAPLVGGEFPGKDLGEAALCFTADFDGDSLPDVLQLLTQGGLFYKGTGPAKFAAPIPTQIIAGTGRRGACLGDYDSDGLPDIFVAAEDRLRLWQNLGGGKFIEMVNVSGEIGYHAQGGGAAADTGDFNNDGLQDILVVYASQMKPQLYFNRGFRSFGQAYTVDLTQRHLLDQAADGQQAGCLGDFNGDGALDMVLVLKNGECWMFPRNVDDGKALAAVATFSLAGGNAGPISVLAWVDERPFGAYVVRAGDPGALFGVTEALPVTIKWRLPGGELQQREVLVKDGPVHVFLDKK